MANRHFEFAQVLATIAGFLIVASAMFSASSWNTSGQMVDAVFKLTDMQRTYNVSFSESINNITRMGTDAYNHYNLAAFGLYLLAAIFATFSIGLAWKGYIESGKNEKLKLC